ncbi:MAG: hypothetical protein KA368_19495 [Acidobacteria bacterium]|nr:hypothetical protein [Acidobacteriota bacterium]
MNAKSNAERGYREYIRAQNKIPFPLAMGGIGLVLAQLFPGGLTGGAGFLIGLAVGFLVPGLATLYSIVEKSQEARLAEEVAKVLSTQRSGFAKFIKERDERSGKITLGESAK